MDNKEDEEEVEEGDILRKTRRQVVGMGIKLETASGKGVIDILMQ